MITPATLASHPGADASSPDHAHPAKFTLSVIDAIVDASAGLIDAGSLVLDPFAGTGRIHDIGDRAGWSTVGVEIEAEWAVMRPGTIHGDSTKLTTLLAHLPGRIDAVVTSPVYGNRMSDSHNARDRSRRSTYKHTLARIDAETGRVADLSDNNAGAMHFRQADRCAYKVLHRAVWAEVAKLAPRHVVLNMSNFIQGRNSDGTDHEVDVTGWHLAVLAEHGYHEVRRIDVATPRNRFGANSERRVTHEHVIVLQRVKS